MWVTIAGDPLDHFLETSESILLRPGVWASVGPVWDEVVEFSIHVLDQKKVGWRSFFL